MDNKKYQVFISSTFMDLMEERKIIHDALTLAGYLPVEMENFGSVGMSQTEYINKLLDQTDYYVLVIAGKYGSLNDDGISYTEAEYDYAVSKNIPILPFVFRDIDKLPREKTEIDKSREKKLKAFRDKVTSEKMCTFYDNREQLGTIVLASLEKAGKLFSRPGWIRANQVNETDSISSCISKDDNVKRIMNAFGKLVKKNGILWMVFMGLKGTDKTGRLYWESGIEQYAKLVKEIDEAYDVIQYSITSDELFRDLTQLHNMVTKAFTKANICWTNHMVSRASGNENYIDEEGVKEYESLMKTIPNYYAQLAEGIRKNVYKE